MAAAAPGHIAQLAAVVASNTQRIDAYLAEKGLPQPSFDASGPFDLQLPEELEQCRQAALLAGEELNELLQGPRELLYTHQHNRSVYLQLIARYNIVQLVPVDGDISFADLAAKIGVDSTAVTRILRFAIAYRLFAEPRPGFVAHSNASKLILEDAGMGDWFYSSVEDMWPAGQRTVDALQKWPAASEPNQTGFSLANNTDGSFFEELGKDPARARRFGGAMSFFISGPEYAASHLTEGYGWDKLGESATVVDVGGSHGDVAVSLATKFPKFKVIVQDLPPVLAGAPKLADGVQVEFMPHDFFQEQPVKDADAYLFRWVLHDWSDVYCVKILRALIPSLKKGASIVIMESITPPPGVLPNPIERKLRAMDITMMEIGNARERGLDEWQALFKEADSRFAFQGVIQPPGSRLAILELKWDA